MPTTGKPLVRYLGHTAAINLGGPFARWRPALTGSSDRSAKFGTRSNRTAVPISGEPVRQVSTAAEAGGPRDGKEILTLKHHDQAVTSVGLFARRPLDSDRRSRRHGRALAHRRLAASGGKVAGHDHLIRKLAASASSQSSSLSSVSPPIRRAA